MVIKRRALLAGVADDLVRSGGEASDDLEDAHLVETARFDVSPALGGVAAGAELAAGEPPEPSQHASLEAATRVCGPREGRRFDRAPDRGDAVLARHGLDRAPDDGKKPEMVVRVQVVDLDAGVAHARDLRVEFAFDVGGVDVPLRPRADEL